MTKVCTKCGVEKALSDFYKKKTKKNKPRSECKSCSADIGKRYRENNGNKFNEGIITIKTKVCIGCGEEKDINLFYKNISYACGYASKCKICYNIVNAKWADNNRSKRRESERKRRESNRSAYNQKALDWQRKNAEKVKQYAITKRKNNPEKYREIGQRTNRRQVANLSGRYLRQLAKGRGIATDNLELLELMRQGVILFRNIKQIQAEGRP